MKQRRRRRERKAEAGPGKAEEGRIVLFCTCHQTVLGRWQRCGREIHPNLGPDGWVVCCAECVKTRGADHSDQCEQYFKRVAAHPWFTGAPLDGGDDQDEGGDDGHQGGEPAPKRLKTVLQQREP